MKTKLHNILFPAMVAASFLAITPELQASFIQLGRTNYLQNFDTLPKSGTTKTLPNGWFAGSLTKQDLNSTITADNGSMNLGGIYSYGLSGNNNRALGLFNDGRNFSLFGAEFQNAGPGSINRVNISYTGEEWRFGSTTEHANNRNSLQFVYAVTTGNYPTAWGNVPGLSFSTPNISGSVGARDGTQAANQVGVSSSISFLNIPQGSMLWIAWYEQLGSGNRAGDGLAIDNFSISAVPEASTYAAGFGAIGLLGASFWKRRSRTEKAV